MAYIAEVEAWAKEHGLSTNGAVCHMCRDFLDREGAGVLLLQAENEMLREKIVALALSTVPNVTSK